MSDDYQEKSEKIKKTRDEIKKSLNDLPPFIATSAKLGLLGKINIL